MLAILGALPIIGSMITAITTAIFNAKVQITTAKIGGDVQVATKLVEASEKSEHENSVKLGIYASSKMLTLLVILFAIPLVAFEWKVVVYDKILGWGSTPELKGNVSEWAQTVIYFLFGAPTALSIGRMFFGRNQT
jgi:hypothetical protein